MNNKRPKTLLGPPTDHHNVAKGIGGSNHPQNKTKIFQKEHRNYHSLFVALPPHAVLKLIIKNYGKCFKQEVKERLLSILDEGEDLYQPCTIKDREKFKEAVKKALWIDY